MNGESTNRKRRPGMRQVDTVMLVLTLVNKTLSNGIQVARLCIRYQVSGSQTLYWCSVWWNRGRLPRKDDDGGVSGIES